MVARNLPLARALPEYGFLDWFEGIVVSGAERMVKPDPRIWRVLLDRYGLRAADLAFIDDNPANVATASALGMHGICFTTPAALRADLAALALIRPLR